MQMCVFVCVNQREMVCGTAGHLESCQRVCCIFFFLSTDRGNSVEDLLHTAVISVFHRQGYI